MANKYFGMPCAYEGCQETARSQGYCKRHYTEMYRKGIVKPKPLQKTLTCSVEGRVVPKTLFKSFTTRRPFL